MRFEYLEVKRTPVLLDFWRESAHKAAIIDSGGGDIDRILDFH